MDNKNNNSNSDDKNNDIHSRSDIHNNTFEESMVNSDNADKISKENEYNRGYNNRDYDLGNQQTDEESDQEQKIQESEIVFLDMYDFFKGDENNVRNADSNDQKDYKKDTDIEFIDTEQNDTMNRNDPDSSRPKDNRDEQKKKKIAKKRSNKENSKKTNTSKEIINEEKGSKVKTSKEIAGQSRIVTVMTIILYLSLGFEIFHLRHIANMAEVPIFAFIMTTFSMYAVIAIILIADNIVMFVKYKKKVFLLYILLNIVGIVLMTGALLIYRSTLGIIFTAVFRSSYLLLRRKTRGKSAKLFVVWQLIFACFFVRALIQVDSSMDKIYLYDKSYSETMYKFEINYTDKKRGRAVGDAVEQYMVHYRYEVIEDTNDGFLNVRISGNSKTEITSIVKADASIEPNTELFFRVSTEDGSYEVTGLKINDYSYDRYAKELFESWLNN